MIRFISSEMRINKVRKHRYPVLSGQKTIQSGLDEEIILMPIGPGVFVAFVSKILQVTMPKGIPETSSNVWFNWVTP
jgi:hypothetical protein